MKIVEQVKEWFLVTVFFVCLTTLTLWPPVSCIVEQIMNK